MLAVERADQSYQWRAFAWPAADSVIVALALPVAGRALFWPLIVGLGAVAALVAGIRLHAPARPVPWYLLTARSHSRRPAISERSSGRSAPTRPGCCGLVSFVGVGLLPVALWLLLHRRTAWQFADGAARHGDRQRRAGDAGLGLPDRSARRRSRIGRPSRRPSCSAGRWPDWSAGRRRPIPADALAGLTSSRQFTGAALVLLIAAIAASTWICH